VSWTLYVGPIVATIVLWWGLTGLIAWMVGRPPTTYRPMLWGASAIAVVSLLVLALVAEKTSVSDAWVGFIAALGLWSWIELSFLTGWITGPKKTRSRQRHHGVRHAFDAVLAILWHEFAIIAVVASAAIISIDAPNRVGLYTLLLLWVMRSSAKLNLFLGVRNLGEVFLPVHLAHLVGYFRQRTMNLLFPFSVLLASFIAWQFAEQAYAADTPFAAVGFTMLATLATLALLEHWLMVLPLRAEALWSWSLGNRRHSEADAWTEGR
jgi:putative photosynthetic complex assembly protein 2